MVRQHLSSSFFEGPTSRSNFNARRVGAAKTSGVVISWRFRSNHPWTVERFATREDGYRRYFYLLDRGVQVELRSCTSS